MIESAPWEFSFSFVSPVFNEQEGLAAFHKRLSAVAEQLGEPYEIIFVNDGSTDDTAGVIAQLAAADSHIRCVEFSRNFGHQAAVTAGYDYATGKAVITLDADCQHPPEIIPELVARWREGFEVVYTVREDTDGISALRRGVGRLVYKAIRSMSGADVTDQADFRLLDRKVVDQLRKLREQARFVRGLVNWLGFKQIGVPYKAERRTAGHSNYTLGQMTRMASAGLCNFSLKPLRIAPVIGAVLLLVAVVYGVAALALWPLGWNPGATAHLAMGMVGLFGVQFLMMGLLGEYLGRVFEEAKGRPIYVVRQATGFELPGKDAIVRRVAGDKPRFVLYT